MTRTIGKSVASRRSFLRKAVAGAGAGGRRAWREGRGARSRAPHAAPSDGRADSCAG